VSKITYCFPSTELEMSLSPIETLVPSSTVQNLSKSLPVKMSVQTISSSLEPYFAYLRSYPPKIKELYEP